MLLVEEFRRICSLGNVQDERVQCGGRKGIIGLCASIIHGVDYMMLRGLEQGRQTHLPQGATFHYSI